MYVRIFLAGVVVIDICFNNAGLVEFFLTGLGSTLSQMVSSNWHASAGHRESLLKSVHEICCLIITLVTLVGLGWLVAYWTEAVTLFAFPNLRSDRLAESAQMVPESSNDTTERPVKLESEDDSPLATVTHYSEQHVDRMQSTQRLFNHLDSEQTAENLAVMQRSDVDQTAMLRSTVIQPTIASTQCAAKVRSGARCKKTTCDPPYCFAHKNLRL